MSIIKVKNKYQVVIPERVRDQIGVHVGDYLEASVENGKITLTPKSLVDREIAEGLEDVKRGRAHGKDKKSHALYRRQRPGRLPVRLCEKFNPLRISPIREDLKALGRSNGCAGVISW